VNNSAGIDVIIPTYNHASLLRGALESLVSQTFSVWRAYVVNNFSTDDTIDVIDSFADERIKRIDFANSGVIAASRNIGFRAGSHPYVAFLDSDDVWRPLKLERVIKELADGADIVCHAERWVEIDGSSRLVRYGRGKPVTFDSLLFRGNSLSTSAVTMRRSLLELIDGFSTDYDIVTAEDYDLWLRAAKQGARIVLLDEELGEFRRRAGSESSQISRNVGAERAVLGRYLPSDKSPVVRLKCRRRLALVDYGEARSYQRAGYHAVAFWGLLRSIRKFPALIRPYIALLQLLSLNTPRKTI